MKSKKTLYNIHVHVSANEILHVHVFNNILEIY